MNGQALHFTLPRPGDDRYKAEGYLKHIEVPVSGDIRIVREDYSKWPSWHCWFEEEDE